MAASGAFRISQIARRAAEAKAEPFFNFKAATKEFDSLSEFAKQKQWKDWTVSEYFEKAGKSFVLVYGSFVLGEVIGRRDLLGYVPKEHHAH
mmetsp:Transcript_10397/g.18186  ORF Transcript_10397/g.18186 Transcript_10397/m.18186 type:complete len:92 (+) Transcript_10397:76-351(+)|eukprot:CAMPEP_0196654886 /NCGR_PEP_ID=MMETSP1086-20130531/4620_1 /TAXON_ID=77921 /ORGANISM="Cyanoptyche  gloeocystis , Strain SAG4.97" /LENGTH=91 /DNA_ID=CAMNT_0041986903 /DNA_START=75 /DNA_END=350 /DNA_ORIENTATION=+